MKSGFTPYCACRLSRSLLLPSTLMSTKATFAALVDKGSDDRRANAAAAAGHEDHLVLERGVATE